MASSCRYRLLRSTSSAGTQEGPWSDMARFQKDRLGHLEGVEGSCTPQGEKRPENTFYREVLNPLDKFRLGASNPRTYS